MKVDVIGSVLILRNIRYTYIQELMKDNSNILYLDICRFIQDKSNQWYWEQKMVKIYFELKVGTDLISKYIATFTHDLRMVTWEDKLAGEDIMTQTKPE